MDFMKLAKQGLDAYNDSQKKDDKHETSSSSNTHGQQTGQHGQQEGHHGQQTSQQATAVGSQFDSQWGGGQQGSNQHGTSTGGGYGGQVETGRYSPPINKDEAISNAKAHGSGDTSLFDTALSFLSSNKSTQQVPIDEDEVTKAHDKVYKEGDTSGVSANLLGSAAALQVLKQFTGGSSTSSSGTSNSQTNLVSLAMAEATKLFDKSSGTASGDKQDAVNGAAMTIMKLLVQSKLGSGDPTVGGKDSGGLSGLLSLASQFAK
ncbi:beta-flanking protein [Coprinopsis sp. MPI-PUGE-AT-0042]|nr:beta-flanking protein [Coprinopsis sp. MPI-PUGE-AT-0042]